MKYLFEKSSVISYLVFFAVLVSCQSGHESQIANSKSEAISKFAVVDFGKTKQVIDGFVNIPDKLGQ